MLRLPEAAKTPWATVTHGSIKDSDCILVRPARRPRYPDYRVSSLVTLISQAWAVLVASLLSEGWKTAIPQDLLGHEEPVMEAL